MKWPFGRKKERHVIEGYLSIAVNGIFVDDFAGTVTLLSSDLAEFDGDKVRIMVEKVRASA